MRILITGAAGWLGRYVAAELSARHELTLLDQAHPDEATVFDPDSPGGRRVEPLTADWPYRRVDLGDRAALAEAIAGSECVIHLAAKPTGDWEGAEVTMESNVMGTFNVLRAAVAHGVRRVVNASSINAFGSFYWRVSGVPPVRDRLPLTETATPVPEDPYSLSKLTTELMTATFTRAFALETVNLRFAGVWPEQRYDRVMAEGLPATTQWADDLFQWVHVRDVTSGIVRATEVSAVTPDPIVLGAGDTRAPEQTLDLVRRFRPDLVPLLHEPLTGREPLLSIRRARSRLDYQPQFSLDDAPVLPA